MDEPTIGQRIRQLRGSTLTQVELAAAADVSVDLIRKLEQGARHTASITSLHRIARALDVGIAELLSKAHPMPGVDGPEAGVAAIRRVLTSVDDLLGEPDDDREPVDLAEAHKVLTYTWGSYWTGRYERLAAVLPGALIRLRAAERVIPSAEVSRAAEQLAELYQVTACTLVHLGYPDSAFTALRAGLAAADRGDDPLRAATMRGSLAWVLLTQGRFAEAHALAAHTARTVEPPGDASPPRISVWGSLLLTAATAAGRDARREVAVDLLSIAGEAAARLDPDRNDYETAFGPAQVTMQTVDVHVVTEAFPRALDVARRLPREAALPLAARSRHLADVALAHTRLGHDGAALDTLLAMEAAAPSWTRYQTLPRQVVRELLGRERRARTPRLRELAGRLGITSA